jgi:hypothetical protein
MNNCNRSYFNNNHHDSRERKYLNNKFGVSNE